MLRSLTILLVAYATGIACVWWLARIVKELPTHTYVKTILIVILPIPPACIGWAVTCYGPSPGNMETLDTVHYLAIAGMICEGLGAGALSVIVFFGALLARARARERKRDPGLSKEARETISGWAMSKERQRPTARELQPSAPDYGQAVPGLPRRVP